MVTDQEYEEATKRGDELYKTLPHAVAARFDVATRRVIVDLNRGYSISFSPERSQDLQAASLEELSEVEVAGVGWSIYFPKLDAGLWVPGLAQGIFGTKRWEEEWAAANRTDKAA